VRGVKKANFLGGQAVGGRGDKKIKGNFEGLPFWKPVYDIV